VIRIPYTPTVYPDETIGSVLTRFIAYNGRSAWGKISRDIGATVNSSAEHVRADHRVVDFIAMAAGFTSDQAAKHLTTLPYYEAFNNARKRPFDLHSSRNAKEANFIRTIGVLPTHNRNGIRFCPHCIAEDIAKYGESYVRRTQQLPTSLVCDGHGGWLQTNCPRCHIIIVPFGPMVLNPITPQCECGHDLRKTASEVPQNKLALKKLASFGGGVLHMESVKWDRKQLSHLLQQFLGLPPHHLSKTYQSHIANFYGISAPRKRERLVINSYNSQVRLELNRFMTNFRAEEFSAFFTSLGFTPDDLTIAPESSASPKTAQVFSDASPEAIACDADFAERAFKHFRKENPGKSLRFFRMRRPRLYWILRLKNPDTLNLPRKTHLPSLLSDRKNIESRFISPDDVSDDHKRRDGTLIRAQIRDACWLNKYLSDLEIRHKNISEDLQDDLNMIKIEKKLAIEQKIVHAINTTLKTERRPIMINHARLARLASLPKYIVIKTLNNNSNLTEVIRRINADKDRRMTLWAAQAISIQGIYLDAPTTLLVAGVVTSAENYNHAKMAVDLVNRGFVREIIKQTFLTDGTQTGRFRVLGINIDNSNH